MPEPRAPEVWVDLEKAKKKRTSGVSNWKQAKDNHFCRKCRSLAPVAPRNKKIHKVALKGGLWHFQKTLGGNFSLSQLFLLGFGAQSGYA